MTPPTPGPLRRDVPGGRTSPAALLLLSDGRFPSGGHAHSGGAEAAIAAGRVHDPATLEQFCLGRLHTTGLVAAALAAAAAGGCDPLLLDAAADARTPTPALRQIARKLGRQMMRAARSIWPDPLLEDVAAARPGGVHQPIVLGLAARAAGLTPPDAAQATAYDTVCGPVTAAVRLIGLDPFHATGVLARLTGDITDITDRAAGHAARVPDDGVDALPSASAPLLDITAEQHATWPVRLFAS